MELAYSQEECNNFKFYKNQLINLGFGSREAKTVLKYIIKYYDNILIHKSIIFADIYYCYEYFFAYYYEDPFSKLVFKILNKWVNNDNHTQDYYSEYNYLYGKLSSFGDFIPYRKVFVELNKIDITKILSFYYHIKNDEPEKEDYLIFKEVIDKIDNNEIIFSNEEHKKNFLMRIEELFRTKINWEIFIKSNNILPLELIDPIYKFLNI